MTVLRKPFTTPNMLLRPLQCLRYYASRAEERPIPPPTPFVPDVPTFLKLIGRNLSIHASKIPSWDALWTMSSRQLADAGVVPARSRKYLMRWRERFRQGTYGIGGDLQHVTDGVGHIRVFEVPVPKEWIEQGHTSANKATGTRAPGTRKVALSVPLNAEMPSVPLEEAKPVDHVKIKGANTIVGKWVQAIKGTKGLAARIEVREGLWEDKRGHKVDGGERRKAEVRSKRRAQERKDQRA